MASLHPQNTNSNFIPYKLGGDGFTECMHAIDEVPRKVFPFACHRWGDVLSDCCKFEKRGCLVKNWQLSEEKIQDHFLQSSQLPIDDRSIFPVPLSKQKLKSVNLADCKVMFCSNPRCMKIDKDGNKLRTTFHYCCYIGMTERERVNVLEFDREVDSFLSEDENKYIEEKIGWQKVVSTNVTLPVCGKHCHNVLTRERRKKKEVNIRSSKEMNTSNNVNDNTVVRWDSDGKDGTMSSEEVIVDWLTTAENCEKYFGGTYGAKNKVNGITKETYHVRISKLIEQTNGAYYKTSSYFSFHLVL